MITLRTITKENIWAILTLEVEESQKKLVAANSISLAQAYVSPEAVPYAIYQDETPVGFVMYCLDPDDDEYWIWRLMIDQRFQGQGYGYEAMKLVLEEIRKDSTKNKVFLGVEPDGVGSKKLYTKLGFLDTGKIMDGEEIWMLSWDEPAL